jgi:hypothetical protein
VKQGFIPFLAAVEASTGFGRIGAICLWVTWRKLADCSTKGEILEIRTLAHRS